MELKTCIHCSSIESLFRTLILNALFCVIAGVCCYQLPDTTGFPLPNSFQDVKQMHEKQKGFLELGGANFDPLKDTDTETSKDRSKEVDDS